VAIAVGSACATIGTNAPTFTKGCKIERIGKIVFAEAGIYGV